ncbi:MAG: hypothetical protein OEZ01_01930 [Candidatus Heimdallarchaeota archaeon]|nr:hypothetical protein [Candidatus Heimdallarchaeota archaeon]MDH5644733.1 hypothetical protein [Candidatus Heimdallarchaeota archaeon]
MEDIYSYGNLLSKINPTDIERTSKINFYQITHSYIPDIPVGITENKEIIPLISPEYFNLQWSNKRQIQVTSFFFDLYNKYPTLFELFGNLSIKEAIEENIIHLRTGNSILRFCVAYKLHFGYIEYSIKFIKSKLKKTNIKNYFDDIYIFHSWYLFSSST